MEKRILCSKATVKLKSVNIIMNRNLIANVKQISNRCLDLTSIQFTYPYQAGTMRSEVTPPMPSRPCSIRLYRHLRDFTLSLWTWLVEAAFPHILLARPYHISLRYVKFVI
jgi:hypothetical protein